MSVVNPTIDDLLSVTDENRFLLCEIASRRARDINDMMRNQHNRAEQLADVEDISQFMSDDEGRAPNPLSIAFDEVAPRKAEDGSVRPGVLSFDARNLHASLGLDEAALAESALRAAEAEVPADLDDLLASDELEAAEESADAPASEDEPAADADEQE